MIMGEEEIGPEARGECIVARGPGEASTSDRPCGSDRVRERREGSPTRAAGAVVGAGNEEAGGVGVVVSDFDDPNVGSGDRGCGASAGASASSGAGAGARAGETSSAADPGGSGRRRGKRRGEGAGVYDDEVSRRRREESNTRFNWRGGRGGLTRSIGSALRTATLVVCILACLLPTALGSLYAPGASPDGGDGTPVTVPTAVTSKLPETTGTAADAKLSYAAYYSIAPYVGVATGGTVVRHSRPYTYETPSHKYTPPTPPTATAAVPAVCFLFFLAEKIWGVGMRCGEDGEASVARFVIALRRVKTHL